MKSLLKFITCGSVDDGKSTLIGHILYDSKRLYTDQKKALELDSKVGSRDGEIDYSLLLDGLTEEREQGITIDVAYRYFTTDHRSFIVADTPGHEEYTRNMAVGASFASLAVILLDATQGVLVQTRRHTRICEMMGIKYFVFAVNKMDLIDYSQERFAAIEKQIEELAQELHLANVVIIPVSATVGDNVTHRSENMDWYKGPVLLDYLETVDVSSNTEAGFYMPVQRVCRPNHTFRGFQGNIEAGVIHVGDAITTLPSHETAHVKSILVGDQSRSSAHDGQAVTISLDREVDVSRGCVLEANSHLKITTQITAKILWMDDEPLSAGKPFFIKLGTRMIPGGVKKILHRIDVNTGEEQEAHELKKNEIAEVVVGFSDAVVTDRFKDHKTLGEFILIDRITNATSACGVVEDVVADAHASTRITRADREAFNGAKAVTVAFDLSKNITLQFVQEVERKLYNEGKQTYLYQPKPGEDALQIVNVLHDAGLIVLLVLDEKTKLTNDFSQAENYFASWSDETVLSPSEAVSFIKKVSAFDPTVSQYSDYI